MQQSFLLQAEDGPRSCEAPAFELTMSAETTQSVRIARMIKEETWA